MYHPKSQVKSNLYTNGNEYYLLNTKILYTGYYYETSEGKKYTGKFPLDGQNTLLTPFEQPTETTQDIEGTSPQILQSSAVDNYNNKPVQPRFLPTPYQSTPTNAQGSLGEYQRYFAKKTNELIYMEISEDTYNKLTNKDPNIAFELYEVVSMPWSLISLVLNGAQAEIIERN
jgi:hypothetical protein